MVDGDAQREPWLRVEGDRLEAIANVPAEALEEALAAHLQARQRRTFIGDRDQVIGSVEGKKFWVRVRRPLMYLGRWDGLGSHVLAGTIADIADGRSRIVGTLRVASDLIPVDDGRPRWSIPWIWRLVLFAVAGFLAGTPWSASVSGGLAGAAVGVGVALLLPWVTANAPAATRHGQVESIQVELARVVGDAESRTRVEASGGPGPAA